jgi:hypothetical protein
LASLRSARRTPSVEGKAWEADLAQDDATVAGTATLLGDVD